MPVGIAGEENAVVTGELGSPLQVRCLAYGYPSPSVAWYRGNKANTLLSNDTVYELRGNVLLIRSLNIDTLGQYTCLAYTEVDDQTASWAVLVRAYKPEGLLFPENELLVPQSRRTTNATTTTTEPLFTGKIIHFNVNKLVLVVSRIIIFEQKK